MSPEPKRPIEELLEASAKARRTEFGADPAMPNPMRARLHDEITRMNRAEETPPRPSWLAMFWPQLSLATAAVLLTAAIIWSGRQGNEAGSDLKLAMKAPAPAAAQNEASAALRSLDAAPQIAAAKTEASSEVGQDGSVNAGALADNNSAAKPAEVREETELQKFADVAIASAAPARATIESAPADALARADVRSGPSAPAPESVDAHTSEKTAMAAPAPAAMAKNRPAAASNLQQTFSQTSRGQTLRNNAKSKQVAANILDTFQVEQDGREIRVVDADGSTYTGKLEAIAANTARRMAQARPAAPVSAMASGGRAAKDVAVTSDELFFRATGFNASLKKQVVFEGNYMPLPSPGQKAARDKKQDRAEQVPARIVGTAKVAGESPVEVDASTVTR